MELHIKISGVLFIALSLFHIFFPKRFGWKQELSVITLFTRQILYVHTFFIAFMLLLMGLLCVTSAQELSQTILGERICLGLGVFWLTRLFFQMFVYSKKLWFGKKFETFIHIIFSFLWLYFSFVFLTVWFD